MVQGSYQCRHGPHVNDPLSCALFRVPPFPLSSPTTPPAAPGHPVTRPQLYHQHLHRLCPTPLSSRLHCLTRHTPALFLPVMSFTPFVRITGCVTRLAAAHSCSPLTPSTPFPPLCPTSRSPLPRSYLPSFLPSDEPLPSPGRTGDSTSYRFRALKLPSSPAPYIVTGRSRLPHHPLDRFRHHSTINPLQSTPAHRSSSTARLRYSCP